MANEATIRSSLIIRSGNLTYRSGKQGFSADVSGSKGPVPGAVTATTDGTDIDLSGLTTPGLCEITNLDSANPVKVGRWDSNVNVFYPLMLLLPGEQYTIRLDPDVEDEYTGTGTGTTAASSTLRAKGVNASVNVSVNAFES